MDKLYHSRNRRIWHRETMEWRTSHRPEWTRSSLQLQGIEAERPQLQGGNGEGCEHEPSCLNELWQDASSCVDKANERVRKEAELASHELHDKSRYCFDWYAMWKSSRKASLESGLSSSLDVTHGTRRRKVPLKW